MYVYICVYVCTYVYVYVYLCMCVCQHFQTSSLKPLGQLKPNFIMEPPWDGVAKICQTVPKKLKTKIFFSRTQKSMTLKLGMQHWVLEYYRKTVQMMTLGSP